MILISNGTSINDIKLTSTENRIVAALKSSPTKYQYSDLRELQLELKLRKNIITASKEMNDGDAQFASFEHSYFNPTYWIKTRKGYLLKEGKSPSEAIEDVFINSSQYAFQCVTSIVLIYYKTILDSIKKEYFNELFSSLLVWDHNYDKDLAMVTYEGMDYIPGDVYYFYNPDFEDPIWMGENAVFLEEDQYFGHGIGILTHDKMVETINTLRKKDAQKSAYLLNQVTRLRFSDFIRYT